MLTTAVLVHVSFYYCAVISPRFLVLFKEALLQVFKTHLTSLPEIQGTALSLIIKLRRKWDNCVTNENVSV